MSQFIFHHLFEKIRKPWFSEELKNGIPWFIFFSQLAPILNFFQIGFKTSKLDLKLLNFRYWSVLVGQSGQFENYCSYFNSFYAVLCLIVAPFTKFHPIWLGNTEVEICCYSQVSKRILKMAATTAITLLPPLISLCQHSYYPAATNDITLPQQPPPYRHHWYYSATRATTLLSPLISLRH